MLKSLIGMSGIGSLVALIVIGLFSVSSAQASRSYRITGRVTAVSSDTITLRDGERELEFGKSSPEMEDVKVGDQVTLWYTMDAHQVKARKGPPQQPGQKPGDSDESRGSGEKKHMILDDRAFYDARNESVNVPSLGTPS